jgi:hypothetical protein
MRLKVSNDTLPLACSMEFEGKLGNAGKVSADINQKRSLHLIVLACR